MWVCLLIGGLVLPTQAAAESYIAPGRVSGRDAGDGFSPLGGAVLLAAIDVVAGDAVRGAIVAFGDSITAGGRTSWPGVLASRLAQRSGPTMAVLNYGIGGNRLLFGSACWGDSGLARLDEALSQSGVTALILSGLGGNDVRLRDRPGDPDDPHLLDAKCDRGDHLHPTAAGSALMAEGIDLSLLLRN